MYRLATCLWVSDLHTPTGFVGCAPIKSKYTYRSKIVGKYNKLYYFLDGNTLVVVAFADMRMHPDNIMKSVLGRK